MRTPREGIRETIAEVCGAIGREYAQRGDGDAALRWRATGLEAVESSPPGAVRFAAYASLALAYAWRDEFARADELAAGAGEPDGSCSDAARQDLHGAQAALDVLAGRPAAALTRYRQAALDAAGARDTTSSSSRPFTRCADGGPERLLRVDAGLPG
jgi:hypothetical protein